MSAVGNQTRKLFQDTHKTEKRQRRRSILKRRGGGRFTNLETTPASKAQEEMSPAIQLRNERKNSPRRSERKAGERQEARGLHNWLWKNLPEKSGKKKRSPWKKEDPDARLQSRVVRRGDHSE